MTVNALMQELEKIILAGFGSKEIKYRWEGGNEIITTISYFDKKINLIENEIDRDFYLIE